MDTRVARTIGPKPVSSSRTTTLATKAVVTNMKNKDQIMWIWTIASEAFFLMLPPDPIWIWSTVMAPKVRRKKTIATTQKTGWRIW